MCVAGDWGRYPVGRLSDAARRLMGLCHDVRRTAVCMVTAGACWRQRRAICQRGYPLWPPGGWAHAGCWRAVCARSLGGGGGQRTDKVGHAGPNGCACWRGVFADSRHDAMNVVAAFARRRRQAGHAVYCRLGRGLEFGCFWLGRHCRGRRRRWVPTPLIRCAAPGVSHGCGRWSCRSSAAVRSVGAHGGEAWCVPMLAAPPRPVVPATGVGDGPAATTAAASTKDAAGWSAKLPRRARCNRKRP